MTLKTVGGLETTLPQNWLVTEQGMGVGVGANVAVGVGLDVGVGEAVGVDVGVKAGVAVGVEVAIGVAVGVFSITQTLSEKTWSSDAWFGMHAFFRFQVTQPVP